MNVKVGDVLNCRHSAKYTRDVGTFWTVTKVGRKWFWAHRNGVHLYQTQFSIETGWENCSFQPRRLLTDEMLAHVERVAAADEALRAWGLQKRGFGQFSEERLLLIADRLGEPPAGAS
ncbi:MAG: hypothetical protein KA129_06440 [Microthrixaceae bacterium]|nr:hypothetical protein [Microthrixaceae bacterium]